MALKRSDLCDVLCRKVGITRKQPGSGALNKEELQRLNAYLDVLKGQVSDAQDIKETRRA